MSRDGGNTVLFHPRVEYFHHFHLQCTDWHPFIFLNYNTTFDGRHDDADDAADDDDDVGTPTLSERAALHVVMTHNQAKSSLPRSAGVDPMYAVLASADLAVVLAVSLGAVLVAIAVIVALVFVASRRRRARQLQRRLKERPCVDMGRPSSTFPRSSASHHAGVALNDSTAVLANGGQHYLLQRATSSASGRQLNVAFAPDVNIELEVNNNLLNRVRPKFGFGYGAETDLTYGFGLVSATNKVQWDKFGFGRNITTQRRNRRNCKIGANCRPNIVAV